MYMQYNIYIINIYIYIYLIQNMRKCSDDRFMMNGDSVGDDDNNDDDTSDG